jgi:RNA polymerase sigma factor (sigma-70 family)
VTLEEGSIDAIEDVYRRQYRRFLRVALALTGGREQADDAVQEAFARAIRNRSAYRGEGTLDGWLWQTLINVCRDAHRRRTQLASLDELSALNGQVEEWPELRAAVAALPERQRLVLFLRHYADLDYEAIATVLGVQRGTVAATLHTAHSALRRAMTEVKR